jgi:hypothetical protein
MADDLSRAMNRSSPMDGSAEVLADKHECLLSLVFASKNSNAY